MEMNMCRRDCFGRALLKYAIGHSFCIRTATNRAPAASVSNINVLVKSGRASTGAEVIACYKFSKARCVSSSHSKESFLSSLVSGAAIFP